MRSGPPRLPDLGWVLGDYYPLTEAESTATAEGLVKTLDKYKVPEKEKNELLT